MYVSPEGVIIAKCDVAPIQSNFYMLILLYDISDFISETAVGLSVEDRWYTHIFAGKSLSVFKGINQMVLSLEVDSQLNVWVEFYSFMVLWLYRM